jgi:hypothetical protein
VTRALVCALALAAALLQLGAMPALFLDAGAAPLLPVGLIAAWASVRRAEETWLAVLAASLLLGAASTERAGWFLLALLPTPALAVGVVALRPRRRVLAAPLAAGLGALLYLALLALASGRAGGLAAEAPGHFPAAAGTALVAIAFAGVIPRHARRADGLFA